MAKEVSLRGLIREIGDEFSGRGWRDDENLALAIAQAMDERGGLDVAAAMKVQNTDFCSRNGATKAELREAVEAAFANRELVPEQPAGPTIVVKDGATANILQANNSTFQGNVNQVGTQINLQTASADELLTIVAGLVVSGLRGEWNPQLALAVSDALDQRDDIDLDRVQAAVVEAAEAEKAEPDNVRELIEKVAVSGIGSFLSSALSSGLGQIPGLLG